MNDAQFKASARADAIRAGMTPKLADYLVGQLGKDHARVLAGDERSPQRRAPRALTARASAPADDRLERMAAMYPGGAALVSEFRVAGWSLRSVADALAGVANSQGVISKDGADAIRFRLMQAQMRKGSR